MARDAGGGGCAVVVCRGCCCGTDKHPDVEHAAHLERIRALAADGTARVRVTGCLNNCDLSNTIVVVPSAAGRAAGGDVSWFGQMHDDEAVDELTRWVRRGGPGSVELPTALEGHAIEAPGRRDRAAS